MEETYLGSCYVAFLDLVAFKNIVELDNTTIMSGISMAIKYAESRTLFLNKSLGRKDVFKKQLNGDAVALALIKEGSDVSDILELMKTVRIVQKCLLMELGLLIRGGIAVGDLTEYNSDKERYFTGSGLSRASTVLNEANPSFLVAIDDNILSEVENGLMRLYPQSVVDGIISSMTVRIDGHSYVRYLDEDVTSKTIEKCVRFYRSYNPDNHPKITSRLVRFIEIYNDQNPDEPLNNIIESEFWNF